MVENSEFLFEVEFLSGPDDGEVKRLYSREVIVGTEPGADLIIASDIAASGSHARIQKLADGFWIEDLGSDRGTMVNGEQITTRRKIGQSDVVRVGHTEFICRPSEPENSVPSMSERRAETTSGT